MKEEKDERLKWGGLPFSQLRFHVLIFNSLELSWFYFYLASRKLREISMLSNYLISNSKYK